MKKLGEEYKKMRQSGQFRVEWFFQYYNTKFEEFNPIKNYQTKLAWDDFFRIFQMYLQYSAEEVLEYLDSMFGVRILMHKDGKFIKVID